MYVEIYQEHLKTQLSFYCKNVYIFQKIRVLANI